MRQLTIDPEFRDKIPPLSSEEFSRLEENILEDGEVREPLVVWKNTIIDGHHRWKIIQKHPELSEKFKIKQMEFIDKWAAIAWMCRNQLGRRNLTDEQRTYLIGKQYEAQKLTHGGDRKSEVFSKRQNGALKRDHPIATSIAEEHGIGRKTVERAEYFSKGLDAAESVSPGIKESVLSGEVKAPKKVIAEIRNMPDEQKKTVVEAIKRGEQHTERPKTKPPVVEGPTEPEDRPAYNANDFRADLSAAVDTFEFALRQHMVLVHIDLLQTEEGRNAAETVLLRAKKVVQKYLKHMDEIRMGVNNRGKKIDFQTMDINTKDIFVDDLGQRDVNRRQAQFNKIMRTFDENLVQPISIALIDGKYYCFDGQMTMKVLKAKNAGRDLPVKCRVYNNMTKLDAANMFIAQRGTTSRVTLTDQIRVMANYGNKKAVDFIRVTECGGLEISWAGNPGKNAVIAVSTLWSEFNHFDDNDLYGMYIRVIKGAWNGDPAGCQAKIPKGLGLFMRTYKGQAVEATLITKLGAVLPNELIRNASADRTSGARKYAVQILQAYNYGLRKNKQLPNLL